jgi:hypothetical protein
MHYVLILSHAASLFPWNVTLFTGYITYVTQPDWNIRRHWLSHVLHYIRVTHYFPKSTNWLIFLAVIGSFQTQFW